jgi:hypothetical protein
VDPLGYLYIPITTLIVSALKNHYAWGFLEVPTDILNHFLIQVAVTVVSLLKRPLRNRLGSETVAHFSGFGQVFTPLGT